MRLVPVLFAATLALAACAPAKPLPPALTTSTKVPMPLLTWPDLLSRPRPKATHAIAFGPGKTDIGDLWLPSTPAPHKTVLMIHGGCWQKSVADRTLMDWAADALAKEGFAVWNIEYRGVDEPGGGYPGTFQDVAKAADALHDLGPKYNLDLSRVVVFGHSAGGHLGVWLAARDRLPATSPLRTANPLPIAAVLNSGGLADLKASAPVTDADCLADILDRLTGPPSAARRDPLSDTSPAEMLPIRAAIISVSGADDRIAPALLGESLTERATRAGGKAEARIVPQTGHVELVAPGSDAFGVEVQLIKDQFNR